VTPHLVIATRNAHKVDEIKAVLGDRFVYHTLRDFSQAPEVEETGNTFEANARLKSEALARWLAAVKPALPINLPSVAAGVSPPGFPGQATHGHPHLPPGKMPGSTAGETPAATKSGVSAPGTNPYPSSNTPWFVLADDSGLEVDALGGAPGVQSARFAAPEFGLQGNAPDGANNAKLLRLLVHIPEASRTARFRCVLALTAVANPASSTSPVPTRFFSGSCEGRIGLVPRGSHGFGYDPLFIPAGFTETLAELGDTTKNRISHRSHALQAFLAQCVA
jgi:XTP/dITP diphosphohydrolase